MRALPFALALALAAAACTAEFPPLDGDAGADDRGPTLSDGATLPFDLEVAALDRGADPAGDAEDRDPEPVDATILQDAAPRDMAPPPDMPPPPARVMLDADEAPRTGCAPRTVTLSWRTQGVDRCTLRGGGEVLREVQGAEVGHGDHRVDGVVADTRFEFACEGQAGQVDASFVAVFNPELPPALDLRRGGGGIDQTQRECATALGERVMSDDGAVDDHAGSAARLCLCRGYTAFDVVDSRRYNCFASPHDNTIWSWDGGQWNSRGAIGHNHCLEHIRCSGPVPTCAGLLYPR